MNMLALLLVLNFSVLGLGYLLGSLVGLFILMGICLLAVMGVVAFANAAEMPGKSKAMHRAFGVDTTFLATLEK